MTRLCKSCSKYLILSAIFIALFELLRVRLSPHHIEWLRDTLLKHEDKPLRYRGLAVVPANQSFINTSLVMEKRRKHLKEACSILGLSGKKEGPTKMFYARNYSLAYCSVPKTGCTNFKMILWLLNDKVKSVQEINEYANDANFHEKTRELFQVYKWGGLPDFAGDYLKFIVVRHPFERLVSAYYNKLVPQYGSVPQFHKIGEDIRRRYGATEARRGAHGEHPSFEEFVDYLINETSSGVKVNDHFLGYDQLCWPCSIDYDVIGHVETLARDVRYLLWKIGAPESFFQMNQGYSQNGNPQTTYEKSLKEFSKIPPRKVFRLYKVFRSSFLMFGYEASEYFKRRKT